MSDSFINVQIISVLWFPVLLTQNKISMKDIFLEYEDDPVEVYTIS